MCVWWAEGKVEKWGSQPLTQPSKDPSLDQTFRIKGSSLRRSVKWRRPGKSQQVKLEHFFWLQILEVYPNHLEQEGDMLDRCGYFHFQQVLGRREGGKNWVSSGLFVWSVTVSKASATLPLPRRSVPVTKRDALIGPFWVMHSLSDQSEGPPMSGFGGHSSGRCILNKAVPREMASTAFSIK